MQGVNYKGVNSAQEGLGEKALHPDEFIEKKGSLITKMKRNNLIDEFKIDVEWYLSQQIMPPVQRLLEVIPEIKISEVAMCLGLDEARYKQTRKK